MKINKLIPLLVVPMLLTSCGAKTLTLEDGIAHLDAIQEHLKDYKDPIDSLHQSEITTQDNGIEINQLILANDLDLDNLYYSSIVEQKQTQIKTNKETLTYTYFYQWINKDNNEICIAFESNDDNQIVKQYGTVPFKNLDAAKEAFLTDVIAEGIKAEISKDNIPDVRKQLLTYKDMLQMAQDEGLENLPTLELTSTGEDNLYIKTFMDVTDEEGYYTSILFEAEFKQWCLDKLLVETETGGVKGSVLMELTTNGDPRIANIDDTWSPLE